MTNPVQILVKDQYGRIIRREMRWFIPVAAVPHVDRKAA